MDRQKKLRQIIEVSKPIFTVADPANPKMYRLANMVGGLSKPEPESLSSVIEDKPLDEGEISDSVGRMMGAQKMLMLKEMMGGGVLGNNEQQQLEQALPQKRRKF
jgi:hypothetical protein